MKPWIVGLVVIAAAVLCASGLAAHDRSVRSTEFAALRDTVARVEGLELVQLDSPGAPSILERVGFDTPARPSLARTYATLRVGERGQVRIVGLEDAHFVDSEHFALVSFGPYRFHHNGKSYVGAREARSGTHVRSEFLTQRIDFGRSGDFPEALPFELRNVGDLVANYSVFLQFLDAWYASGRSIDATDLDGTVHNYSLTRDAG